MGDGRFPIRRRGVDGEVVRSQPPVPRADERDDGPSADDLEKFGGVTRSCPSCGKDVYDDAVSCYHCGADMETPRHAQMPKVWIVVVVLLLIGGLVYVFTR